MESVTSSRSSRVGVSVLLAVGAMLVALLGPVGAAPAQAAGKLSIAGITVECECGGAGYLWGWRSVVVKFQGARDGRNYQVAVKGGPTVDATSYGRTGYAYLSRDEVGFEAGKTYRFTVKELRGKRVVRTSRVRKYTVPTPVAGPERAHVDTITRDGEEVMVAGETYRVTFDGEWAEGIRFASGVDAYFGTEEGDDRFGWYQDQDYPLPWTSNSAEPILEFTPPAEFAGTRWNLKIVGYRAATKTDKSAGLKKGRPIPGSEWGFAFSVHVIAAP